MRRWLLLAVLFSLTAWATLALTATPLSDPSHAASIVLHEDAPGTTGDPDARWEVAYRPGIPLESSWKLSPPRADFGRVRTNIVFTAADSIGSRAVPSRSVPTSLLDIPLLI